MPSAAEIALKIEASLPLITKAIQGAEALGVETMYALMARRIFNEGKKTDGTLIGAYSGSYKKTRERKGLETDYVNLQFSDRLFQSLAIGTLDSKVTFGMTDANRIEVAGHLEKKFGVIFQPSQQEVEQVSIKAREYLFEQLELIVKSWQ